MKKSKQAIHCDYCPRYALARLDDEILCVECIVAVISSDRVNALEHRIRPLDTLPFGANRAREQQTSQKALAPLSI
jgi:hypothetical protein